MPLLYVLWQKHAKIRVTAPLSITLKVKLCRFSNISILINKDENMRRTYCLKFSFKVKQSALSQERSLASHIDC